jgi:hypothetical protein
LQTVLVLFPRKCFKYIEYIYLLNIVTLDCEMISWHNEMMFGHDENVVKTKVCENNISIL